MPHKKYYSNKLHYFQNSMLRDEISLIYLVALLLQPYPASYYFALKQLLNLYNVNIMIYSWGCTLMTC